MKVRVRMEEMRGVAYQAHEGSTSSLERGGCTMPIANVNCRDENDYLEDVEDEMHQKRCKVSA